MQPAAQQTNEEGEEDEELDLKLISSFADKIQHSGETRPNISIPKRGEKDFEPLAETVKLQEMMLQRSREALFGALQGVRGGAGKSISHAVLTPGSPYPHMLVTRGHLLDTMGITVRTPQATSSSSSDPQGKGKGKAKAVPTIQLLPEEALFLLERGSLQIWMRPGEGAAEWDDAIWGVPGAVEMSVADAFAAFLGKDGLTWERYQAYAVLKRLGYTVHRTRRFIPQHFLAQDLVPETFQTWWLSIPRWLSGIARSLYSSVMRIPRLASALPFSIWGWLRSWRRGPLLISDWRGSTYSSLFAHLRIVPTGHTAPLQPRAPEPNPYTPFYHVWKPAYPWAKNRWDKGSAQGLKEQPPSYYISAVDSRTVPMPTIHQLTEIWDELPDEPKGPVQRKGPQYKQFGDRPFRPNPMAELRNGDRAFIVAVNDSGNTGWLRFGRTGFGEQVMI